MRQAQRLWLRQQQRIAAALMLTGAAGASGTLDQASTTPNGGGSLLNSSVRKAAQTFTAGLTGPLTTPTSRSATPSTRANPNLDPTLTLETVSSGIPTGTVARQTTIPSRASLPRAGRPSSSRSTSRRRDRQRRHGVLARALHSGSARLPRHPITQGGYIWGESTFLRRRRFGHLPAGLLLVRDRRPAVPNGTS